MKLGKKILSIFNLGKKTVREISAETNIPKSTVHYHKQKLKERTSDAKTDFWESESGRNLVIRLVIATIYMFALKSGNGAGNLNEFFELLELDKHAGISESTILKIIKRVEALILEYKEAVEKDIKTKVEEIKVILGVDETWFDNMYLVCQELSSGYLFFETASEQRDADSWEAHIKKLFSQLPKAKILYFVSDRALALVNLAVKKYEVSSVADCFHFKYIINKLCCLALSAKLNSAKANYEEAQKSKELIDLRTEQYIRIQFHTDIYVKTMRTISHVLHPFYDGYKPNTKNRVEQEINLELSRINQLTIDCEIKDKYKLISKAQNQVSDVVAVIPIWHDLVSDEIEQMNLDDNQKYWFMSYLLPKMYWIQALNKTKYKPIREQLKKELQVCEQNKFLIYEQSEDEYEILKEKAVELCRKFQRASSQVEGRNGFLSLINHNQKSFDNTRLEVMTVIHNFDTRGIDGKTPAERLFGKQIEFQPLFEYILNNFDDLPRPRKRKGRLKINAVQH